MIVSHCNTIICKSSQISIGELGIGNAILVKNVETNQSNEQSTTTKNMKNKWIMLAAAAALTAFSTAQAIPVTGNIGFSGSVTLDTQTAATATTVVSYSATTTVNNLSPAVASGVTPVWAAPWTFFVGAGPSYSSSSAIIPFWTIGNITFNLNSWTAVRGSSGGNADVVISGLGTIQDSSPVYTPTAYNYSLTLQDPTVIGGQPIFSFSASQAPVPDGGTTAMLLGSALSALAMFRKKLIA